MRIRDKLQLAYEAFSTLREANKKVNEVGIAYRKWHDDVAEVTEATAWHNGGKSCSDGVDEKGGFFWIGARTRTEMCRVDVHRCLVDWVCNVYAGR
jgi:hypothetical protein